MIAFRSVMLGVLAVLLLGPGPAAAVDLTMYYPVAVGGPVTKIIDDMVSRFEKENADIKVSAVYAGNYTDTMTKAMTAMKGGQPPQLSVLLSTDVFTLMDEKAIVPMDDLVADKSWFKEFYPAFMANGQVDGKTWSIPFQRSTIVLYWNKDAFKEAGLDQEKAPASWDEMADMARKLVKKDASGNTARWGVEIPTTG
jgi:sn-glycerol 3-phosphate transport system substrate-binding protein